LDRNLGKTNALNEKDLAEFVELQKLAMSGAEGAADSENSWSIDVQTQGLASQQYDLSAKNPNKKEETTLRQPQEILEEMKALDEESAEILSKTKKALEIRFQELKVFQMLISILPK
jgi:type I restriction enzyme M protein